ncbi:MAG TPA: FliH/SctL family protein [Bryobacteraceae bacterium]|nr:FliH/SctL family protein [Bryobacteraceae bacterium]
MSSKLQRGPSFPAEPLTWQRVSSLEAISSEGQSASPGGFPASRSAPQKAGAEVEQRVRQAHQQGYEEGRAASRQAHAAQLEALQMKLARTIEEMAGLRSRYRHEAEQDAVALALAVARRILHRELTVSPDALLGLVKAALEKMDASEVHRVRVSREDAGMVRAFFEKIGLPHRIEVIADPAVAAGGVILESDRGSLDASAGTQLAEIERGLADLVRRTA